MEYDSKYDYYDSQDDSVIEETKGGYERFKEVETPQYDIKDAPKLFENFIKEYNKHYTSKSDYEKHYATFVENLKDIIKMNRETKGSASGINMFTDLEEKELNPYIGIG